MLEKHEADLEAIEERTDIFAPLLPLLRQLITQGKELLDRGPNRDFCSGLKIIELATSIEGLLVIAAIKINNDIKRIAQGKEGHSKERIEKTLIELQFEFKEALEEYSQAIDQHQGIKGIIQDILNVLVSLINRCIKTNKIGFFVFEKTPIRSATNEIAQTLDEICSLEP